MKNECPKPGCQTSRFRPTLAKKHFTRSSKLPAVLHVDVAEGVSTLIEDDNSPSLESVPLLVFENKSYNYSIQHVKLTEEPLNHSVTSSRLNSKHEGSYNLEDSIKNHQLFGIVDTGAQISCISENFTNMTGFQIRDVKMKLRLVDGSVNECQ
ncbi:hypothetical protein RCL1_008150 [Eukaryota sp. TZLM3-RCL]